MVSFQRHEISPKRSFCDCAPKQIYAPNSMSKLSSIKIVFLFFVTLLWGNNHFVHAQNKRIDSLVTALEQERSPLKNIPILRALSVNLTAVDPDKKYIYAKQMRNIAEKYKIDSIIPLAYLDMAMVHGIKTDYDSSMYYFTKGLRLAIEKKIPSQEARSYVGIGYTFDRLDNPKEAIDNYKQALKIFKKLNHKRGLNQTHINLGSLYFDTHEYKIAESYFRQVLNSYEEMNDEPGIAYGNFILGNTSRVLNKDEDAYKHYTKSLAIREKLGDLNGIALANFGLGELYLKQNKFPEALKALKIAIDNNRTLENKYQEAVALITLARVYLKSGDFTNAQNTANIAHKTATEVNSKGLTVNTLEVLIEVNEFRKNYKKAFEYQQAINVLKDSLDVEKIKNDFIYTDFKRMRTENSDLENTNEVISTKNLTYKKAIYIISSLLVCVLILLFLYLRKIRQKSAINKILVQQAVEIKAINEQLESVNEELIVQNDLTSTQKLELERINAVKNKFFSIVSHDLRSPIATLKMLFNSYFSGYLTQEEMDDLLKKLEHTIYNTADFLDNLLEWSKSQLEGMVVNSGTFDLNALINKNLEILNPQIVEKSLQIENNLDDTVLVYADKNMINVVLRNVISNSIKFCNESDSIIFSCQNTDKSVVLAIKDSGVGIQTSEQGKIFQLEHTISQGTSGEKGHHIGLVLCKDMVEQNHGRIWFESTAGVGTTFFIEIPKCEL